MIDHNCIYCGFPCDPDFTVDIDGNEFHAHLSCYEAEWKKMLLENEKDYQAGKIDWHVVNGEVVHREKKGLMKRIINAVIGALYGPESHSKERYK